MKNQVHFFHKNLALWKNKISRYPIKRFEKKFIYQLHKKIELKKLFPSTQIICSWRFVLWLKGWAFSPCKIKKNTTFMLSNLYLYFACLSVCLFVCLCVNDRKIRPNIFEATYITQGMFRISKICLQNKFDFRKFFWIH